MSSIDCYMSLYQSGSNQRSRTIRNYICNNQRFVIEIGFYAIVGAGSSGGGTEPCVSSVSDVEGMGVLQKLGASVMSLNTLQAQELEVRKRVLGKMKQLLSTNEVRKQINDNVCELQK